MSQLCSNSGRPPKDNQFTNLNVGNLNVLCESTSRTLVDLQLRLNNILENLPSSTSGPKVDVDLSKLPVIYRTGNNFLPNANLTSSQISSRGSTVTKSISLGQTVKSAWVALNVQPGNGEINLSPSFLGYFANANVDSSLYFGNSLVPRAFAQSTDTVGVFHVYVSEDFTKATRFGFKTDEYDPRASQYVWMNDTKSALQTFTDSKTYSQLGNMLFGCYFRGNTNTNHGSIVLSCVPVLNDGSVAPENPAPVVITKMYLDNSIPGDTQLVFELQMTDNAPIIGNTSYLSFATINNPVGLPRSGTYPNIFAIYPIN